MNALSSLKRVLPSLICLICQTVSAQSTAELLSQLTSAREKGSEQKIAEIVRAAEKLWGDNPNSYLDFEFQAAQLLETSNRTDVVKIFDNVMNKKSPQDTINSGNYFLKKTALVLRYLSLNEISGDQARLLQVAGFIGETRTNMIPGFIVIHKGLNDSVAQLTWYYLGVGSIHMQPPTIPPIKTNTPIELKNSTNAVQMLLGDINRALTPRFLNYISRFLTNNPTNSLFVKQIISAAHLTEEERKKLVVKTD